MTMIHKIKHSPYDEAKKLIKKLKKVEEQVNVLKWI